MSKIKKKPVTSKRKKATVRPNAGSSAPKRRAAAKKVDTAPHVPRTWYVKLRALLPRPMLYAIGTAILIIIMASLASLFTTRIATSQDKPLPPALVSSVYNVADVMAQHPTTVLVSNQNMLNVLHPTLAKQVQTFPLNSCPSASDTVMKSLQKRSVAVLLHVNNTPGPQQCTLAQIVQAYGRPNSSTTLTGTLNNPHEVLLFYDAGPNLSGPIKPTSPVQAPATIVPTTLTTISPETCSGSTILTFVAHEDDDLLFMNPDHMHELRAGDCLRTVYLTAGDAGMSSGYWLARETGAEAAYDAMIGRSAIWLERSIEVNSHEYIRMASPRGYPNVSLVFIRLPDGNITGGGFARTHYESLARLSSGAISIMTTVDGVSTYSKADVISLLASLMRYYHPNQIDTQTPINMSTNHPDHSDHMATGQATGSAYAQYAVGVPLHYYTGYPTDQLSQNVVGSDLSAKSAIFYAYAVHDSEVSCRSDASCAGGPYAQWLARQYTYIPGMAPITTSAPTQTPVVATAPAQTQAPATTDDGSDTSGASQQTTTDPPSS